MAITAVAPMARSGAGWAFPPSDSPTSSNGTATIATYTTAINTTNTPYTNVREITRSMSKRRYLVMAMPNEIGTVTSTSVETISGRFRATIAEYEKMATTLSASA